MLPEGGPLDVVHDVIDQQIGFPEIEEPGDVGMIDSPEELDLTQEALPRDCDRQLGVEHLQRYLVAVGVAGQEHPRRASAGDFTLDLE